MLKIFRKFPFTHFKSFGKCKSSTHNFATAAAKKPEVQAFNESFLSGSNSAYIERIFEDWIQDKTSVHSSWDAYFTNVLKGYEPEETFQMPPSLSPSLPVIDLKKTQKKTALSQYLSEILRLELMIQGFQFRGNEMADLDPLRIFFSIYLYKYKIPKNWLPRRQAKKSHEMEKQNSNPLIGASQKLIWKENST